MKAATPTSGAADLLAMVSKALREAYNLGQRYWQQADSEYISQHKKAGDTRAKFLALVEETCAALAAGQATAAPAQPAAQAVVPAEWPTNEMIDAGRKAAASQGRLLGSGQSLWHVFRAMLAAAPAQPAAQQGVAYAALPTSSYAGRVYEEGFLVGTCPLYTADQMRAFADATHMLRASAVQETKPLGEEHESRRRNRRTVRLDGGEGRREPVPERRCSPA